jgi:hypothetical protein
MKKVCIVIQGPSNHVPLLKEKWGTEIPLIWSTWIGEESKYDSNDIVVFSEPPVDRGVHNLYMQTVTTLNGINKAKELGFENVIKMRSDQFPTNPTKFVNLFDENKITFLSGMDYTTGPLLIDYFMGGSIHDVELLWSFPKLSFRFPEQAITSQLKNTELKTRVSFTHNTMSTENEVWWVDRNFGCYQMLKTNLNYFKSNLF